MRTACLAVFLVLGLFCRVDAALVYEFSSPFANDSEIKPSPTGEPPWLRATFTNSDVVHQTVTLRLEAVNLPGEQFVTGFYFNFDPSLDVTQLDVVHQEGLEGKGVPGIGRDAFRADPDGYYDLFFEFSASNGKGLHRFVGDSFAVYEISYLGVLDEQTNFAESFHCLSTPAGGFGPYHAVGRIQGLPDAEGEAEDSTWVFGTTPGDPGHSVPEPTNLLPWLVLGLLWLTFRRPSRAI
ncbi:MAG: hypothetical protein GX621_08510 [Pirellulaceae bacterium]|nr:hypothetical protein [Pirellulaceae bacterium]